MPGSDAERCPNRLHRIRACTRSSAEHIQIVRSRFRPSRWIEAQSGRFCYGTRYRSPAGVAPMPRDSDDCRGRRWRHGKRPQRQTRLRLMAGEYPECPSFLALNPLSVFWRKVCWTREQRGELPGIVQCREVDRHRPDLHCILHLPYGWMDRQQRGVYLRVDDQVVALWPAGKRAQPSLKRPHARDRRQFRIVAQRR
jgi:hypothetical protein